MATIKGEKPKRYVGKHSKTKDQQRQERALEEGLEETFPASDAVAATEPAGRQSNARKTRAAQRIKP